MPFATNMDSCTEYWQKIYASLIKKQTYNGYESNKLSGPNQSNTHLKTWTVCQYKASCFLVKERKNIWKKTGLDFHVFLLACVCTQDWETEGETGLIPGKEATYSGLSHPPFPLHNSGGALLGQTLFSKQSTGVGFGGCFGWSKTCVFSCVWLQTYVWFTVQA